MQILKIKCALCKRGWGTSKKDDKNLSRMHLDDFINFFVCGISGLFRRSLSDDVEPASYCRWRIHVSLEW